MDEMRFTRKAVEDLSDIWDYTADMWSERQADTYYRLLIASCRKLAGNPVLFGREYKELGADIFGFKVNKHIVFYRIAGDKGIEVVRILLSVGRRVVGDLAQRVAAAAADLYRPVALVHSPYTVAVFRAIVSPAPPPAIMSLSVSGLVRFTLLPPSHVVLFDSGYRKNCLIC